MSLDSKWPQRQSEEVNGPRRPQGVGTYVLLVLAMALVTVLVTGLCLLLIRSRLSSQVRDNLSQDLIHSVSTFEDLQAERLTALDRENALLANLPTLKALMTSGDDYTIQDGVVQFWQISGNDLFAVADASGRVVAVYTKGTASGAKLRQSLTVLLHSRDKHYLSDGAALYACSVRPLYFGANETGTLLGYVVSGSSIERTVRQISEPTGVEAAFLSDQEPVAGTLDAAMLRSLAAQAGSLTGTPQHPSPVMFSNTRYLAAVQDLSANATSPLRLIVLKSFAPAEQSINRIDRMIMSVGLIALLSGAVLMAVLSGILTRPLEDLSKSVRAFGVGDGEYHIPRYGTREVRQLSEAFSAMRSEIRETNKALLESERLATIGRMASSVSHDFRHYLAAIYANAEFLASGRLTPAENAEIFAEVRNAVLGTTEMIESLLVFSRAGANMRRAPELIAALIERAAVMVRSHPDAKGVEIATHYGDPTESAALVDGKQVERALFNLILNACQSARAQGQPAHIGIFFKNEDEFIVVDVVDNGGGVPDSIRHSLFQPFVSEGKQKGTGLGLTLASRVAEEHGGDVQLLSSKPGETIFQIRIARGLPAGTAGAIAETENGELHEKLPT